MAPVNDAPEASQKTIFFVDVDGVLNIGIRDGGKSPLGFSKNNVEHALAMHGGVQHPRDHDSIEMIVAVNSRWIGHGEDTTYAAFSSDASWNCCDAFARRLALLIQAVGPNRHVVLSSTWRLPQHRQLVSNLEWVITQHLGEAFSFDGRTSMKGEDRTPSGRTQVIGDYLETYGAQMDPCGSLKVVVLEDFHITALDGSWCCDQQKAVSSEVVERYLRDRTTMPCEVKLIHTYDSWISAEGRKVEIGSGLTMGPFQQACDFLGLDPFKLPLAPSEAANANVDGNGDEKPHVPRASIPLEKLRAKSGRGYGGFKTGPWFSLNFPDFLHSVRSG